MMIDPSPPRSTPLRLVLTAVRIGAVLAAGSLLACGPGTPEEPVARVRVESAEVSLPYPQEATLETVWRPEAPLPVAGSELRIFVHLLDREGAILRTFDHAFPGPWTRGRAVRDSVKLWQSALAPALPPGRYRLTLGLVERGGRRRWPLAIEGVDAEPVAPEEYPLATLVVPAVAGAAGARLEFTGPWGRWAELPDRQVIRSRELEGEGAVVLQGLDESLTVALGLHLPRRDDPEYWVGPAAGTDEVAATVRSPCAGEPVRVSGAGDHRIEVRITPPAGGGDCPIWIEPDFTIVDAKSLKRVSPVHLWYLTWSPSPA
jgi:hypothetical protein